MIFDINRSFICSLDYKLISITLHRNILIDYDNILLLVLHFLQSTEKYEAMMISNAA